MPKDKFHKIHTFQKYFTALSAVLITALCYSLWAVTIDRPKESQSSAADCTLSAQLVNPCRPLVGLAVGGYTQVANDSTSQFNYATKRLNNPNVLTNASLSVTTTKKFDIAHVYQAQGSNLFSNSTKSIISNGDYAQTFVNWKPLPSGFKWKDADGNNATVNSYIRTGAQAVKALGSRKIFLAIWHEPEDDVSTGSCTASANGASMGSPADYVNMWHNVRAIFNQEGVTNAVWAMNYMGFSKWNCLVPLLWPGNSYVDWVVYDPYAQNAESFGSSLQNLYNYLSQNSDTNHAYTSKPWGLAEHGYWNASGSSTESSAATYWNQAKTAIDNNTYPRLKMYMVFDTNVNGTSQVGMTFSGQPSTTEQTAFNGFSGAVLALQSGSGGGGTTPIPPTPPADTTAPSVSITVPTAGATVSKVTTVTATANDNIGVTEVKLYIDDTIIKDDVSGSDGWTSQWDTTKQANGVHTLKAIAYDAAGNTKTATISVAINNAGASSAAPSITSFSATPATVTVGNTTRLSWATSNTVSCSITPGGPTNSTATSWQTLAFSAAGPITYTLTCKNSAGTTASANTIVTVQPAPAPPSNVSLTTSATSIQAGQNVTLSWTSVGSTGCVLNPGSYNATGSSSSKIINNLKETTTFKVTCSNNAGSTDSNSVLVQVTAKSSTVQPPLIASFEAKPGSVDSNGTSTLSWTTSNVVADGCRLSPSPLTTASANGQWTTPPLTASASYTLTCKNSKNEVTSKSVSVTVANQPAPTAPAPATSKEIDSPAKSSSSTVKATTGQSVVDTQVEGKATQGQLITLEASTVTDSTKVDNISKVEFYNGDVLVQTATAAPFALDTKSMQPGTYSITQRTYFDDGSTSQQSQIVTIEAQSVSFSKGKNTIWFVAGGALLLVLAVVIALVLRRKIQAHDPNTVQDYDLTAPVDNQLSLPQNQTPSSVIHPDQHNDPTNGANQ
jgi:hypothetical protein